MTTQRRADMCATHHHACDCREFAHSQEIEKLRAERDALNARISAMEESTHYANGCSDLAMKHRDIAEAELAALRARIEGAATGEVWKHDCIGGQSASHIVVTREAADGLCPFGRVALVPLDD